MMRTPFFNYHFLIRKFDLIVNDIRNFVYYNFKGQSESADNLWRSSSCRPR